MEKIICSMCGGNCIPKFVANDKELNTIEGMEEYAKIDVYWGYFSDKDQEYHKCILCEQCYDEVVKFIESKGGKIEKSYYDLFTYDTYPMEDNFNHESDEI